MPNGEGFHPRGWRGSIASCIDIHRISKRTKPIQKQTCRIQQEILLGGQCEAWGLLSSHLRVVPSRGQQQELLSILEPSRSECRNSNPRQLIWDLRLSIIFTWALAGGAAKNELLQQLNDDMFRQESTSNTPPVEFQMWNPVGSFYYLLRIFKIFTRWTMLNHVELCWTMLNLQTVQGCVKHCTHLHL